MGAFFSQITLGTVGQYLLPLLTGVLTLAPYAMPFIPAPYNMVASGAIAGLGALAHLNMNVAQPAAVPPPAAPVLSH